jgi:hypothetical protein
MRALFTYSYAIWLSFLPPRYRRRAGFEETGELRAGTILSGIGQGSLCLLLYVHFLSGQITPAMSDAGGAVLATYGRHRVVDEVTIRLATGVLGVANFALQPLNMFILYLGFEGLIRTIGAATTQHLLGTLPLYIVSAVHGRIAEWRYKRQLGAVVIDEILPPTDDTYDVRVLSCRPKPDWNSYITIRFRDEFYILAGEEIGEAPRPYVYRLRKNPTGRLVVVIRDYKLSELPS